MAREWSTSNYSDPSKALGISRFLVTEPTYVVDISGLLPVSLHGYAVVQGSHLLYVTYQMYDGTYLMVGGGASKPSKNFSVSGAQFTMTDADGTVERYASYDSSVPSWQQGQLLSRTYAGGDTMNVTWDAADQRPASYDYFNAGNTSSTPDERFAFQYTSGSNTVAAITQSIGGVAVRTAQYGYYASGDANGSAGDLEYVTLQNGDLSAPVVSTSYYRWYTADTGTGYAGGLKSYFDDSSYEKALKQVGVADGSGQPTLDDASVTDAALEGYATNYFEYSTDANDSTIHRVSKQIVAGLGNGGGSGTGEAVYTFAYATNPNATGTLDSWQNKTTVTYENGTQDVVYTNVRGDVLLKVTNDTVTGRQYRTWNAYDTDGNIIKTASGNAVTGYSEGFGDLVGYGQAGTYISATGRVDVTNYYEAASGDDPTLDDSEKSVGYQLGASGAFIPTESWTYTDGGVVGDGVWNVATDTTYPNADGSAPRVTGYSYNSFWQIGGVNTSQPKVVVTSLPQIGANQNGADGTAGGGPSSNYQTTKYYDPQGRVVWSVDGGGYINYTAYDPLTGAKTKEVDDVDPSTITTAAVAGPTRASSLPAALNLTTTIVVDSQGRKTKVTDPNGNVTYWVYDDSTADGDPRKVIVYNGWNATTHLPTGPVWAVIDDPATGIRDTVSYAYTGSGGLPVDGNGVPTGAEWNSSNKANIVVQSLVRQKRNVSDQVVEVDQFTTFTGQTYDPSSSGWSTLSTGGANSTKYKYNSGGNLFQTTTAKGTITMNVIDARGLTLSSWVGTYNGGATETDPTGGGTPGNNMVMTASYAYDADGNQTQMIQYPHDGSANRVTQMYYDFRDRLVATQAGVQASESTSDNTDQIAYTDYDNLGEATATYTYDGDTVNIVDTAENAGAGDGVPDKPAASLLRSELMTQYDDQGRVYATHRFSVDPSNGNASSSSIDTNDWYDARDELIETRTSGSAAQKMTYDGAGREIATYTSDGGGDSTYADAGNVTGDTVVEQTNTTFDSDGNVILTMQKRRFHDATGTGALGRPTSGVRARLYYVPYWYDAANRLIASAQIGTNFGTDYTRGNNPPARSDTKLVTSYAYDAAGRLYSTTDPRGLVNLTYYDLAGRTTKTIANYVDGTPSAADDQTITYSYDNDNNLANEIAKLPGGAYQTTQFIYGANPSRGDGLASYDVLAATQYPDPATGIPMSSQKETYKTNALRERIVFTDRNGTTHAYHYDVLGRTTLDAVTTLGTGVDGTVRAVGTTYNTQGLVDKITSYADAAATTVVNEVERTYNGLGQVTGEYQSHAGSVDTLSTPEVQYGYGSPSSGSRLTSMTYPNGRVINYNYASGLDDAVGRLSNISDSTGTLEAYQYLGMSTVVIRSHPQSGVSLSYVRASGEGTGDAGDQYTGLDRFDRVVNQKWVNASGTIVDQNTYTYDRDGNVLTKNNPLHTALNATYAYDGLNRLSSDTKGGSADQSWALDALGNSGSVTTAGTSVSRTNNSQNQLTQIGGSTLAYDGNGNTTTDEQGRTLVYDAWNRLVEARSGSTSLIRYAYDGLNRRVRAGASDVYFDTAWQDIEDRTTLGQVTGQQVWSAVYVDAMVEQDRDTDADGTLDQRLYPTQDANFDVTAVTNASGVVQARYDYTAYGDRTVLNPTTYTGMADTLDQRQGFQDGRADAALPNVILFRNRWYDTATQRWTQEDPLGTMYQDGMNLYHPRAAIP